jgi:type IV pilus assembly protein PilW
MTTTSRAVRATFCHKAGLTLIELLVAITIGAILIFGATQIFVDSRNSYATNETSARLQETARYAFSILESDIRMANYWGLVKGAFLITGQGAQDAAAVFGGNANDCGTNFIADLNINIEGANNQFALGPDRDTTDCAPYGTNGAVATADTLTIRRAAAVTNAPAANVAHICSTRVNGILHADATACAAAPSGQGNNLLVASYYVSRDSTQQNGVPSLRRKRLISGPQFQDEEIIPGIEDMQVQFGIDPTGSNGTTATRYVDPDAVPAGAQIVSVRVWLLVRSDTPEVGFVDDRTYVYGDRLAADTTVDLNDAGDAGKAFKPGDSTDDSFTSVKRYRRLLVSRTLQVRNALGT